MSDFNHELLSLLPKDEQKPSTSLKKVKNDSLCDTTPLTFNWVKVCFWIYLGGYASFILIVTGKDAYDNLPVYMVMLKSMFWFIDMWRM